MPLVKIPDTQNPQDQQNEIPLQNSIRGKTLGREGRAGGYGPRNCVRVLFADHEAFAGHDSERGSETAGDEKTFTVTSDLNQGRRRTPNYSRLCGSRRSFRKSISMTWSGDDGAGAGSLGERPEHE